MHFATNAPAIARSAPIGVFIGAIPGLGSAISAYLNYGIARALSRHPERFGKGAIEGVIYVDSRIQSGVFSPEDLELLQGIASSAAIAIDKTLRA